MNDGITERQYIVSPIEIDVKESSANIDLTAGDTVYQLVVLLGHLSCLAEHVARRVCTIE